MALKHQIRKFLPPEAIKVLRNVNTSLRKVLPVKWLTWYSNLKVGKYKDKSTKDVFTDIYTNNSFWGGTESVSGTGSDLRNTKSLIDDLNKLLVDFNISSVLDIPCGDFNWMNKVNYNGIDYVGADIVEALVKINAEKYKEHDNLKFVLLNLIEDPLPKSDLIIVRDCFVHLSMESIYNSIKNIKASGSKYLITTSFPEHPINLDIITGGWRTLNFQAKPFNFPKPVLVVNENYKGSNGEYKDKSMILFKISEIVVPEDGYFEGQ